MKHIKYWLLVLVSLLCVRFRVRYATCATIKRWGIKIGHPEQGELATGCAMEDKTDVTDVSLITITPIELVEQLSLHKDESDKDPTSTPIIPKILHQSFKTTNVPNTVLPFVQSWHDGLSSEDDGWTFVWWTDNDLEWITKTYYQQYYDLWKSMPHNIMKVDLARYFLLHKFGGVYADMDIEYITSNNGKTGVGIRLSSDNYEYNSQMTIETKVESTLEYKLTSYVKSSTNNNSNNITSIDGDNMDVSIMFHECQDNSLMASTPGASFWVDVFDAWEEAVKTVTGPDAWSVNIISGITMLRGVCYSSQQDNDGHIIITNSDFYHHHGTNSWRWKTKRDNIVHVLDNVITAYVLITCVLYIIFFGITNPFRLRQRTCCWYCYDQTDDAILF